MAVRSIFSAYCSQAYAYAPCNGTAPNNTWPLFIDRVEFDTNGEIVFAPIFAFVAKRAMFMRFHYNMLFQDVLDGIQLAAHLYIHRVGTADYVECAGEDSMGMASYGHSSPQGPSVTKILKLSAGDKVQARPFSGGSQPLWCPSGLIILGEVTCNYFQGEELSLDL